ncbi:nuclear pore complex protein Nup153-like isoform X1 [Neodiprion lecontei]|uniref:Nuclear pore complex protein Nup153-like isoform X1 n=1 Tax=Neodiprion lecontei TaxID=441921 RepID=A0A6J0BXC8_NEOLC|nr:nuclear pore complex protein Nup153-like isoform X1 [Neodiprion lecontei]
MNAAKFLFIFFAATATAAPQLGVGTGTSSHSTITETHSSGTSIGNPGISSSITSINEQTSVVQNSGVEGVGDVGNSFTAAASVPLSIGAAAAAPLAAVAAAPFAAAAAVPLAAAGAAATLANAAAAPFSAVGIPLFGSSNGVRSDTFKVFTG